MGHDDASDEPASSRDSVDRFYDAVGGVTRLSLRTMGLVAAGMEARRAAAPPPACTGA